MAVQLPGELGTVLPMNPADGQLYVDYNRVKWRYDAATDLWYRAGVAEDVPLADEHRPGLMGPRHKDLLDRIADVPGGFGIITDRPVITPGNPDGVITGDIELTSESLDIVCVGPDDQPLPPGCASHYAVRCEGETGKSPGLGFKLSESFLKTLLINLPGPPGADGDVGDDGLKGRSGYSQGPKGRTGGKGASTTKKCTLGGYRYEDLPGLTDEAIVDVRMTENCKLTYAKTKLDLPTGPAEKIRATAVSRSVLYDAKAVEASKSCISCVAGQARLTSRFGTVDLKPSSTGSGVLTGCQTAQVSGVQTCDTGVRKQITIPLRYSVRCGGTAGRPTLLLAVQHPSCITGPGTSSTNFVAPTVPVAEGANGPFACNYYSDPSVNQSLATAEVPYTGCKSYQFTIPLPDVYGQDGSIKVDLAVQNQAQCDAGTRLGTWALSQPPGDATPLDVSLVRLAKNGSNSSGDPVAFNTYPLTEFVGDVAGHYGSKLEELDARWRKEIKERVLAVDDKARTILSELAGKLAECEFSMPAQVCVTTEACPIPPQVVSGGGGGGSDGGGSTPACCFLAGSPVRTEDGGVTPIEAVSPGDRVPGVGGTSSVVRVKATTLGDRKLVGINGGEAFFSADHPLLSVGGWVCADPGLHARLYPGWLDGEVSELKPGVELVTESGAVVVRSVELLSAPADTPLYDLTLDESGDHTYWVRGYAVHNCSPTKAAAAGAGFGPFAVGAGDAGSVNIGQRTWKVRS